MAAPIRSTTPSFDFGTPVALFQTRIFGAGSINKHQYTVAGDGRFLINQIVEDANNTPITLILNWQKK